MSDRAEAVLDALGNPMRRQILKLLHDRPQSVGELARKLPVSRPAVSRHLRVMEEASLVGHVSEGTRHIFRVEQLGFVEAQRWLEGFWDDALARFALVAENSWNPEYEEEEPPA
ncbi:MAG: metalloregulator ArsR/SmtB family transcription factor [Myxococcota bacterium]